MDGDDADNYSENRTIADELELDDMQQNYWRVTGGRDHNLLNVIARKMNFQYEYLDPSERTQGAISGSSSNMSFSGALGMLQKRVCFVILL